MLALGVELGNDVPLPFAHGNEEAVLFTAEDGKCCKAALRDWDVSGNEADMPSPLFLKIEVTRPHTIYARCDISYNETIMRYFDYFTIFNCVCPFR